MLKWVRRILVIFNGLNWTMGGVAILTLIAMYFLADRIVHGMSARFGAEQAHAVFKASWIALLLVLPATGAAHIIFKRLIAVIDSVAMGAAFSMLNVVRLRQIAWALLVIQIVDLGMGWLAIVMRHSGQFQFGWHLSFTGWFVILMLFVLAKVFEQGAVMRDELDGTI